ncbi:sulfatase [Algoriphagus vanfongensis]|uniref:sulfatase n=1 Tax=Algoriphagus vanfongensis TaxID=426371 RepID=UPI0003FBDF15|nr:sulfatase [Algoriphagus vanfongensis]
MDRLGWGILFGTVFHILSWQPSQARNWVYPDSDPPNILLIYVDDLGYGDIGPYGNHLIETPNLDRLAGSGLKFTQAYAAAPLCSPSRAAMLTGKSTAQLGFEFVTKYPQDSFQWDDPEWLGKFEGKSLISPPYSLNLPLDEITIAEALKSQGYTTGIVGKWHVAAHNEVYKGWSKTHGPVQQGFDWAVETFGTHPYDRTQQLPVGDGMYPEDELTEKTREFLALNHTTPFFLLSSFYFVHTPLKKKIPWIFNKYKAKYPSDTPDEIIHYAVNVELMDHFVGRVLNQLEESGLEEETLVIFTSDNGGNPEIANNGGLRGSKWNLYEGGIRVPMIASWKGKIAPGTVNSHLISQIDFMPTFMDLSSSPDRLESWEGITIVPLLFDCSVDWPERSLSWHFPYYHPEGDEFYEVPKSIGVNDRYKSQTVPHSAWRQGDYKLLYFYETESVELYDLSMDSSESKDLSKEWPKITKRMTHDFREYMVKVKARIPKKSLE